jgi:hypothetical protein
LAVVATVGPSEHGRFADLEDVKSEDTAAIQVPLDETDLASALPRGMTARLRAALGTFERTLPGFAGPDGQLIGYAAIKAHWLDIGGKEPTESEQVSGLHPCGEGAICRRDRVGGPRWPAHGGGHRRAARPRGRRARGALPRPGPRRYTAVPRAVTLLLVGLPVLFGAAARRHAAGKGPGPARGVAAPARRARQRLADGKDLAAGARLREDMHALEQRVGAAEAKVTQALEAAKQRPPAPAASRRALGSAARSAPDPMERRAALVLTESRRRPGRERPARPPSA